MEGEINSVDWLKKTLIFQSLSTSQLVSILQISQLRSYSKGELLFVQGSEATGFFVVKRGRVKVFKVSATGKEQILNIFGSGENFAEVAALDGKHFPASAATLEASELIFFPRSAFLEVLHQHPDIAIDMLLCLSQHLRHLTNVIEELSFKDVPQRLVTYLLKFSRMNAAENALQSGSNPVVTLNLTKSQLASTLGTIPATLSRAFYYLSSEKLIAVHGSKIELLDRDRLQELSYPTEQNRSPG